LDGLARVALAQHRHADAQALFTESLSLRQDESDVVMIAQSLEGMAALAAARGQLDRALCLAGAVEAVRTRIGAPLHPEDRVRRCGWLDPLTCLLGSETITQGLAVGENLTLDQAVALALEPPDAAPAATTDLAGRESSDTPPLSAREREVAALVAQGLSNRQIGDVLVITDRTVAAHVEHILDKLGFSSRTQIGVWAAEHGLVESSRA
jgi:DNA-binding CsgD family transcriptional regulator